MGICIICKGPVCEDEELLISLQDEDGTVFEWLCCPRCWNHPDLEDKVKQIQIPRQGE